MNHGNIKQESVPSEEKIPTDSIISTLYAGNRLKEWKVGEIKILLWKMY
jgi:hypothetical protein